MPSRPPPSCGCSRPGRGCSPWASPPTARTSCSSVRNELFRQLVEQEGYRTIAIESDCLMGLVVDDYVTSGTGTLDEVMERGFSHEWGAFPANRELVRWMRAYNDGRPGSERLRFAGFDGPLEITGAASPRQALTALHAYLTAWVDADLLPCTTDTLDRLLGADDRWTEPRRDDGPVPVRGADTRGQAAAAARRRPGGAARRADATADRGVLAGRLGPGAPVRAHRHRAAALPLLDGRHRHRAAWRGCWRVRDSMMAANLLAIAERGPALVYAHNGHLQRDKSSMRMGGLPLEWWSAGAIVSAHLGDGYAFLATALGTIRHQGVDTPPPDTIEGLLYALPEDRYVVDARRLAAVLGDVTPAPRVSPWFGYSPLDPAHAGQQRRDRVRQGRPGAMM